MIEVALTPIRKVRFWLGELPVDAEMSLAAVLRGRSILAASHATASRCGAVELYMPVGPRRYYALLGGTYVPTSETEFWIEAGWSRGRSDGPQWSLDGRGATRGLTEDEARAVVGTNIASYYEPLAGRLTITHALSSETDTVPVVLRAVTRILLGVLFEPGRAEADEFLKQLASEAIRQEILTAS